MGWIQDKLAEWKVKREMAKQQVEDYKRGRAIEDTYEQKKHSHYERELAQYYEEQRQKKIKEAVQRIRAMENRKVWSGRMNNPLDAKNVVAKHKKIFDHKNTFVKAQDMVHQPNVTQCKNVTKGKNIFVGRKKR